MNDRKTLLQRERGENQATKEPIISSRSSQTAVAIADAPKTTTTTAPSEVAFSVCCFCVYCPLCVLWCCVKQPCTIGWRAVLNAKRRFSSCCSGGGGGNSNRRRVLAADYSSFSDIDSDDVNCKIHNCSNRIA